MRVLPLFLILLILQQVKPAFSQSPDLHHDTLDAIAARFTALDIPDLEKIQLPQAQSDGSFIFIYVWFPKTHRPTTAYFEANVADYFDILGAQHKAFAGWCYIKAPETRILEAGAKEIGVVRIWAMGFRGHAPRGRCRGGLPSDAGRLGQTQVFKDPRSGLLSMVRSGHPTRFPAVEERLQ
jgi:hypothetical protein